MCQSGVLGFYYPSEFSIRTCLNWRLFKHERSTIDYLKDLLRPGDVFVDIGAHIGYFAYYVGKLVGHNGRVFAFEPYPDNFKLLLKNCSKLPQVKAIQSAVSDSSGKTQLFIHTTSSSSHSLSDISRSDKSCLVPKVSLDEWGIKNNINRIDAVLIDVEGYELAVLRGMHNIINKNPGICIIIEYCPSNWTKCNGDINMLIEEIYNKIQFKIICALGQKRKYILSKLTSVQNISSILDEILDNEVREEQKDYINIVINKV